jgi:hypothetical protein
MVKHMRHAYWIAATHVRNEKDWILPVCRRMFKVKTLIGKDFQERSGMVTVSFQMLFHPYTPSPADPQGTCPLKQTPYFFTSKPSPLAWAK